MAKPTPFFPQTPYPSTWQECGQAMDISGELLERANVTLAGGYAASGAVSITGGPGDFTDWPIYGYVRNEDSGEEIFYSDNDGTILTVKASGRGLAGTSTAAGNIGDEVKYIESRCLGLLLNQMQAEIATLQKALLTPISTAVDYPMTSDDFQRTILVTGSALVLINLIAPIAGQRITIINSSTGNSRIIPLAATKFRMGTDYVGQVGTSGYAQSTGLGQILKLFGISTTEWYAEFWTGNWDLQT